MMKKFLLILCVALVVAEIAASGVAQGTDGLKSSWEGVIEAPKRPLVLAVDFGSGTAKLDATGSSSWTIRKVSNTNNEIQFEIALGEQIFQFDGQLHENEIRGSSRTRERVFPFHLERLPTLSAPKDRVEAWQQDLDAVVSRFLKYDRSFSPEARAAFQERVATLRRSLQAKSDQQIMVELARAVALSGNAHTRLYLIRNRTEVRRLPIRVWWFKDQLHVVRATPEQTDLLGCRILGIGALDVAEAAARVRGINAGIDSWQRYMGAYFLTSPDVLFGAGVIQDPEQVSLKMKCAGESRSVRLGPLPLRRSASPVEAWWDLAPDSRDENAAFVPALRSDIAPLYLRNTRNNYWFEYLPDKRALYVNYNRSHAAPGGMTMKDFTEHVVRELEQRRPAALIFDMRFNTGGDLTVGTPLIKTVSEKATGIPVFVLTGRATFSAGITHVVQLKQWANATIVGEHVGDDLDMWSEGGNVLLPNSKLTVHYGNAFHGYSKRAYPDREILNDHDVDSVAPDVIVEPSWSDYIAGKDPLLEVVFKRIK